MSIPTSAFLDTSILDGQNYNFSSKALSTFAPACKSRAIKLLLPAPIESEVKRHIKKRSQDALDALEAARRQAPFLSKWRHFPTGGGPDWEVSIVASQEWASFLRQFDVLRLGYDTVDLSAIMEWYDTTKPPFRDGKKRKEFPDALAIAMLDAYARKTPSIVAVVSFDEDMKLACERFSSLLYFKGLPALTELLLSEDGRIAEFQTAIQNGLDKLSDAVHQALDLRFFHSNDDEYSLVPEFEYGHPHVSDVRVVGIGDREATVTFEAEIVVKYELNWTVQTEDEDEYYYTKIEEDITVSGSAKVAFDQKIQNVATVGTVEMDDAEIELRQTPPHPR